MRAVSCIPAGASGELHTRWWERGFVWFISRLPVE